MSTHPGMLIAYTDTGEVVGTLDYMVQYDDSEERRPLGLIDFAAHEENGGEMLEVWNVQAEGLTVKGSKVWPEYIGAAAHDFKVELSGPPGRKRIEALVHKTSGFRRERKAVEDAIQARVDKAAGQPADIRDLVGGPDRPLPLDADGQIKPRPPQAPPKKLPLVKVK